MGTRSLGSPNPNNLQLKPTILAYETALVLRRVYSFSIGYLCILKIIVGKRCKTHDIQNGKRKELTMVTEMTGLR